MVIRPKPPTDDASSDLPRPSCDFGNLASRILDHWFAATPKPWPWWKRATFTLIGSATFFLTWLLYIISSGITDSPDAAEAVRAFMAVVAIPGSLWFAGITAWKDLGYGPVRLYIAGFLLPYFVWTLIWIMLARPHPEILL